MVKIRNTVSMRVLCERSDLAISRSSFIEPKAFERSIIMALTFFSLSDAHFRFSDI